jgi:hypothetical protein
LIKLIIRGVHQEEENEVDLNLPGRKGLQGLMKEDWNDRDNWRKNI